MSATASHQNIQVQSPRTAAISASSAPKDAGCGEDVDGKGKRREACRKPSAGAFKRDR